jgi:hypothetical protein
MALVGASISWKVIIRVGGVPPCSEDLAIAKSHKYRVPPTAAFGGAAWLKIKVCHTQPALQVRSVDPAGVFAIPMTQGIVNMRVGRHRSADCTSRDEKQATSHERLSGTKGIGGGPVSVSEDFNLRRRRHVVDPAMCRPRARAGDIRPVAEVQHISLCTRSEQCGVDRDNLSFRLWVFPWHACILS